MMCAVAQWRRGTVRGGSCGLGRACQGVLNDAAGEECDVGRCGGTVCTYSRESGQAVSLTLLLAVLQYCGCYLTKLAKRGSRPGL